MVREELYFLLARTRVKSQQRDSTRLLSLSSKQHTRVRTSSRTTDDMNNMCTFIQQLKMKSFTNPSSN